MSQKLNIEETSAQNATFKQKDKWKKFFFIGIQKLEVNSQRALKNGRITGYHEYVTDTFDKFTDNEKLRVITTLADNHSNQESVIKERILDTVLNKVNQGNFDFKNGHSILVLSQTLSIFLFRIAARGRHGHNRLHDLVMEGKLNTGYSSFLNYQVLIDKMKDLR